MLGVNITDVIIKVSELTEISEETMRNAIDELHCPLELVPFYVLYYNVLNDCIKKDDDFVREYGENVIGVIESVSCIKYEQDFKNILLDCFILYRQLSSISLEEHISKIEKVISKYKNTEVNTICWFIIENLKRELLRLYSGSADFFKTAKSIIDDIKQTDEQYKEFLKTI